MNSKTMIWILSGMAALLAVGCLSDSADFYNLRKTPDVIAKVSALDTLEDGNTECQNGADDDGDGLADCRDPGCMTTAACLDSLPEDSYSKCQNGLDDDGDWLIDCADPQCQLTDACKGVTPEDAQSLCQNGIDDDGDGLVDCADPQCLLTKACMAVQPEDSYSLCFNKKDDDGNGLIDCQDTKCLLTQACGEIVENTEILCSDRIDNDAKDGIDCADPKCGNFTNCQEKTGPACSDRTDNDGDGLMDCADPDCQGLIVCQEKTDASCSDRIDNDGDGKIDCADEECLALLTCAGESTPGACANGTDDDGDGQIDCDDADCKNLLLCLGESILSLCQNKIDDDGDGAIDCSDADCAGFAVCAFAAAGVENSYLLCSDGADNDNDGLADCLDNDCAQTEGCMPETACRDNQDNDMDGKTDCEDNDCVSNILCMPETQCHDLVDNDQDNLVDCADKDCWLTDPVCQANLQPGNGDSTTFSPDQVWGEGFPPGDKTITIVNNCSFPLWSHVIAKTDGSNWGQVGDGKGMRIEFGQAFIYTGVPNFREGRVYAYYVDPGDTRSYSEALNGYNQFIEMRLNNGLNYNISYEDYISLPVSVRGDDGRCPETKCSDVLYMWVRWLKDNCPHPLDHIHPGYLSHGYQFGRCTGSYLWCTEDPTRNLTDPYCTKMADAYSGKYNGITFTGADLYGGKFSVAKSDTSFWNQVAAWNRGSKPGDFFIYDHYQPENKPFNEYGEMIHRDFNCKVKAFSTDTAQGQDGAGQCDQSKSMTITWCPDHG